MDRLFRQRMQYLDSELAEACFLCEDSTTEQLEDNLILLRNDVCLVVLNRFPYNTGHLLVSPLRHVGDIEELTGKELEAVMALSVQSVAALRMAMRPEGFNIGANLGTVAGAGVPGHMHMHVVPRWSGDTNFMPAVARTKVLPETLEQTYARLRPHFPAG